MGHLSGASPYIEYDRLSNCRILDLSVLCPPQGAHCCDVEVLSSADKGEDFLQDVSLVKRIVAHPCATTQSN
jgi:hypothetical protein